MATGLTAKLRKLRIGESFTTTLRTSEVHIFAKRLGIKVKTSKQKKGVEIKRIRIPNN